MLSRRSYLQDHDTEPPHSTIALTPSSNRRSAALQSTQYRSIACTHTVADAKMAMPMTSTPAAHCKPTALSPLLYSRRRSAVLAEAPPVHVVSVAAGNTLDHAVHTATAFLAPGRASAADLATTDLVMV
jgi:hypothetical protein